MSEFDNTEKPGESQQGQIHRQAPTLASEQNLPDLSPNLLRLNIDSWDTKLTCIFVICLIMLLPMQFIISSLLPSTTVQVTNLKELNQPTLGNNLYQCKNPSRYFGDFLLCGDFNLLNPKVALISRSLSPSNQALWVNLQFVWNNGSKQFNIAQQIKLNADLLTEYRDSTGLVILKAVFTYPQIEATTNFKIRAADADFNRVNGIDNYYYTKSIGYIYPIHFNTQWLAVTFTNFTQFDGLDRIDMYGVAINPQFTNFTIIFRIVLFIVALASCIKYTLMYRSIPAEERVAEQKVILVMSFLSTIFNDPFFAALVLKPNGFSAFLSTLFITAYISYLLFCFIFFADRVRFESGEKATNLLTWPRISYTVVVFCFMMGTYFAVALKNVQMSPFAPESNLFNSKTIVPTIILIVLALGGILYAVVLMIRSICKENLLQRQSLTISATFGFTILVGIFFIASQFRSITYDGSAIVLVYLTMNAYSIMMQSLYTATPQSIEEIKSDNLHAPNRNRQLLADEALTLGTNEVDLSELNASGQ